ncbi:MAG TPA: acetoin utilization protein AcuC [Thermoplasmata archaeon]|nr:acetoin utilization protein AcuC [Thermoplasmata archaeon]
MVVWDPAFRAYDFGPNHPFQERSRELAVGLLEAVDPPSGAGRRVRVDRVPVASRADLLKFHHAPYLDLVERRSGPDRGPPLDGGDTPSFPGCFEAAARVVGGALRGAEGLANGEVRRAFHPAGGLHHAHPNAASGFCIFNDIGMVIASHVGPGRAFGKVAYIDIDAHHGDGVMYGFYDSGRVLDIDFHQDGRTLFPGTGHVRETGVGDGAGLKVNLPLPPGAGDEVLLTAFRRVVPTMLRTFRPELIVLQHGVDGHVGDRLAGLRYGPGGYAAVLRELLALSEELCRGRILVTGGGGYASANVARVLARAGLLIAGSPEPNGRLPEEWRRRFEAETGEAAPREWTDPEPSPTTRGDPEAAEFLVDELSQQLGVRFPALP